MFKDFLDIERKYHEQMGQLIRYQTPSDTNYNHLGSRIYEEPLQLSIRDE
jgi:hypothetical protein